MTIVYDKLMALAHPRRSSRCTTPKDCMLYALGVGLGHDPMNEDELAFVYEKNLKVLPTMAPVHRPQRLTGCAIRDTGIDWVKVVQWRAGLHACTGRSAAQGTVSAARASSR